MNDTTRCWVEVDLGKIRQNIAALRSKLHPAAEMLAVVKANAYGHGAPEVARAIADQVEYFGTACLKEAAELGRIGRDILLLSPCLPGERPAAVENDFIVTVSSSDEAAAYAAHGPCRINFKVDTGMGRIGCWHENALTVLQDIQRIPDVQIHSFSSHLPSSDEDESFTLSQLRVFEELVNQARALVPGIKTHVMNSAGILGFGNHAGDIVRAGLALFGSAYPAGHQPHLSPALAWKARIVQLRNLPPGRTISYGRTYTTDHEIVAATVSAGYADGYPRQASNKGAEVLIRGVRCPILGRVTMDQIVVDASAVENPMEGDEVVLVGRQGSREISARELAEKSDTIAWHVFTGISSRVRRFHL